MKLTSVLTGTILLLCPVAFGQNSGAQNNAQSKQVQTTASGKVAKPAVKSVQFKSANAKPAAVKTVPAKAAAPKPAMAKPARAVPAKAVMTKAAPAKSAAMHASPATMKKTAHASGPANTDKSSLKVATYPAKKATSAPRKHVVNEKKVANVKKDPFEKGKKAAIEVTKTKTAPGEKSAEKGSDKSAEKKEDKVVLTGRRDPFVSPVMEQSATGSGCSTGKRCLAIDQISLKGIVKSENGMIAVVENALDKAYFLHENDPVFNGYVVKITGDSIIFRETLQDKLGKAFTRDVTKRISTPAV